MCHSEKTTALGKYFEPKLAVIEVKEGETEEEAWRRYLALNPGCANTHIKIFHFPAKKPLNTAQRGLALLPPKAEGDQSLDRQT